MQENCRTYTIPTSQPLELGQAHPARMNYESVQLATASQAESSRKHNDRESPPLTHPQRDQQSCDLSGRCRTRHSTLALVCSFGFSCTTHRLQTSFVALPFSPVFCLSMQKNLDGSSTIPDALNNTSVLGHTCHRSSSTSRILTTHICTRDLLIASELFTDGLFPCSSRMTTSGHFADTHGLTGYEPNLTNSQFIVAWADTQNLLWNAARLWTDSINHTSRRSTRNFTEEANAHKYRDVLAEQHVYWRVQTETRSELPTSSLRKSSSNTYRQKKNSDQKLVLWTMNFLVRL